MFVPFKDPDRRREYGRQWIRNNAQKAREAMRRWRANHPAEHAAETRSYYARHKEQHKAFMTAYHLANPGVVRTKSHRRRALKMAAQGSFTTAEWLALVERYRERCGYCGVPGPLGGRVRGVDLAGRAGSPGGGRDHAGGTGARRGRPGHGALARTQGGELHQIVASLAGRQ